MAKRKPKKTVSMFDRLAKLIADADYIVFRCAPNAYRDSLDVLATSWGISDDTPDTIFFGFPEGDDVYVSPTDVITIADNGDIEVPDFKGTIIPLRRLT